MQYKKTTLKNGLRLITVPMKDTKTATVVVMVGVGSRYESEKEAGLSHFIEHMLFKGTQKRPDAQMISEELDSIGGEFNAFTSKEKTGYYAKVDSIHVMTALDVIADIYLNSKVDPGEIAKEKGAILQELNMYEDNPMSNVDNVFEGLMYAGNPLGRKILGTKKTVSNAKRQDFVDYMNRFYTANDTVVCVAGKFDEAKIIDQVGKYFFQMKKGKKPVAEKVIEKQKSPQLKIEHKKTDQTHFILGVRAYHENHKDRFVLTLLSIILGGNMSSRLFIEVRERLGLAYYVRTGYDAYHDCGYLATQAGVEHEKIGLTIETILKEYRKIATEKISERELQKAKDYIKGKSVMGLEASDEVAMFFIDQELKRKKIMTIEDIFVQINKVTVGDILRVARDIFTKENLNLAVIGPHEKKADLKKMLVFKK